MGLINDRGPTSAELAEIEAEWPLIAAELELVAAEAALLEFDGAGVPELARRRVRRAEAQVVAEARRWAVSRFVAGLDGVEGVAA